MRTESVHPSRPARARTAALLAAVIALGLVVRVYRLGEQSLWWDDYNGLAHLTVDNFLASMQEARRVNPEGAPLYHAVQWLAASVIGGGEYAHRLLNVLIGAATIPLVYAIGRNSFGARAGLLSALLFAMSPPHIHHAQSLRIYPLAMLLAAAALFTMERILSSKDGRWVLVNALLNGALCMTHLFGLFAVAAQAAAAVMALFSRHRRLLAGWACVQLVCLLPAAYWVSILPRRTAGDFWHFSFPTLGAIVKDLFGDDLTDFSLNRAPAAPEFLGFSLETPWLGNAMAVGMMGVFVAVALWALLQLASRANDGSGDGSPGQTRPPLVLMLCFWALPVFILVTIAYFWWPVVYPRYTLYACLGLYVLVGGLFQAVPGSRMRLGMVTLLVVLYAYQLALLLPSDTRTQWRQAANDIAARAAPGDIVLVGARDRPEVSHRTLCYHLPAGTELPVALALSIVDAMEQLRCHFARPGAGSAWYVLNTHYFALDPRVALDYLNANGAAFTQFDYPAEEYLKVYHVANWPGAEEGVPLVHPAEHDATGDLERRIRDLGLEDLLPEFQPQLERGVERGVEFLDDVDVFLRLFVACLRFNDFESARESLEHFEAHAAEPVPPFVTLYGAFAAGDIDTAIATLLALPPEALAEPQLRIDLELALWAAGEQDAARASYRAHQHSLTPAQIPWLPLLDALLLGDTAEFRDAALVYRGQLLPHGYHGESNLYRMGGLESWVSACLPPWSPGSVAPQNIAAALEVLAGLEP